MYSEKSYHLEQFPINFRQGRMPIEKYIPSHLQTLNEQFNYCNAIDHTNKSDDTDKLLSNCRISGGFGKSVL